jgi:hypothetical protein
MWSLEALSYENDITNDGGTVTRAYERRIDNDQLWRRKICTRTVDIPPKWQLNNDS